MNAGQGNPDSNGMKYLSSVTNPGFAPSLFSNSAVGALGANVNATERPNNEDDGYGMFGDDDENATNKPSTDEPNSVSGPDSSATGASDAPNTASESKLYP